MRKFPTYPRLTRWGNWVARRRKSLMRNHQIDRTAAARLAFNEARVRANLATVLGVVRAKTVPLHAIWDAEDWPLFVMSELPPGVAFDQARVLREIPTLRLAITA